MIYKDGKARGGGEGGGGTKKKKWALNEFVMQTRVPGPSRAYLGIAALEREGRREVWIIFFVEESRRLFFLVKCSYLISEDMTT